MIEGVRVRRLEPHHDERGSLTELLRSDWPEFEHFGQALLTLNRPGVIRGWHAHRRQTDVIVVIGGTALVAMYDARDGSTTRGELEDHVVDGEAPAAIFVPPGVYHGYRTLGNRPAVVLNFPTELYDPDTPDEFRVPHDYAEIGYDWEPRLSS